MNVWLVQGGVWSEIADPLAGDEGQDLDDAMKDAGYSHAVTLGSPGDLIGAEFRAEVWAHVAGPGHPASTLRYLCLVDLGMERIETLYCALLPDLLGLCAQLAPLLPSKPLVFRDAGHYVINLERLTFVEPIVCKGEQWRG